MAAGRLNHLWVERMACFAGCLQNELVALHNRHLVRRIEPDLRCVRAIAKNWLALLPKCHLLTKWSREKVIENTTQSKRERVRNAFRAYDKYGWTPKDAYIRMFIKHEKGGDSFDSPADEADPRAIQYRSFKHTSLFKQWLMPVEAQIWKMGQDLERSPMVQRIFSKGMNPRNIANNLATAWGTFGDPVADLWDVSRMDAHMGRFVRELIEFPTYRHFMPEIQAYLECMRKNRAWTKSGIAYEMEYTMCSGEACTGSGDSIVMAAVLKYVYRDTPHHILVCGDDSVVVRDRSFKPDLTIFEGAGLPVKFEQANTLGEVEFCQRRPVRVAGVWQMVSNPYRLLSRLPVTIKNFKGDALKDWLYSVGQGELQDNSGVPILQVLCLQLMALGGKLREHFLREYLENRRTLRAGGASVVEDSTRASFALAWGVSVEQQKRVEAELERGLEFYA